MKSLGKKYDDDYTEKPPIALLPISGLFEAAKVMGFGATKYGKYNWAGGIEYTRLTSAAMRHILYFLGGEDLDPETGISHIAHAICCLLMLHEMIVRYPDMDDRLVMEG